MIARPPQAPDATRELTMGMGSSPSNFRQTGDYSPSLRQHLSRRWSPQNARVLVVGDSMLDAYVIGSVGRISPEAPVPVIKQAETRETAGGAANVAANIASLGGVCHLVTCLGSDSEGSRLAALLAEAAVTTRFIDVTPRATTVKTRFATGQQQILRLDREDVGPINEVQEEEVAAAVAASLGDHSLLVISDYNKGMLTDRVLDKVISLARQKGIPVLVDPKRRNLSAYRGAAVLKPNRGELEAATGLPVRTDAEVERAALAAAAATGAAILVTRSEAGMSLVQPDGSALHMPTHSQEVYDVTGAGDTVMAALALGVAAGRSLEEAMAFANLAGGIAVSKHGTALVLAEEIEAERSLIADRESVDRGGLVTVEEAVRLRKIWRRQGLAVGFTNGCFDLLHPGHISLLRGAAQACDRLVVGLNGDASVRRLKGADRPVQTMTGRATVLGAIEDVDLVVAFDEDTPLGLIERLVPDVLIKGADYEVDQIVGAEAVKAAGGRVMTVALVPDQSTTKLLSRKRSQVDAK
jgi:D-beta-D-heptose 7-phosphate kinase/D-beta-D-heptose 1-phosphate adenosyltransferase